MTFRLLVIYYSVLALGYNFCVATAAYDDGTKFITEGERQALSEFAEEAEGAFKRMLEKLSNASEHELLEDLEIDEPTKAQLQLPISINSRDYLGNVRRTPLGVILALAWNHFAKSNRTAQELSASTRDEPIQWVLFRKGLVNEIHGTDTSATGLNVANILLHINGLSKIYEAEMLRRGAAPRAVKEASVSDQASWLLAELGKVKPDREIVDVYSLLKSRRNKQLAVSTLYKVASAILTRPKAIEALRKYGASPFFIRRLVSILIKDMNNPSYRLLATSVLPTIIRHVSREILNYENVESKIDIIYLERFVFHYVPEAITFFSLNIKSVFVQSPGEESLDSNLEELAKLLGLKE